ncbi:MAG: ATP-binding protein [Candidatus Helarchaeota archaeon]
MSEPDYYDIVRQKLTLGPLRAPPHPKIFELLKIFWDQETIKVLSYFPPVGSDISIKELAEKTGMDRKVIKKLLNNAAKKRTIAKSGNKYSLEPLVPGIFEAYFIVRADTQENLIKAAEIYRFLFKNILSPPVFDTNFTLFRPLLPTSATEKIIQVDATIQPQEQVMPYELVEDLINKRESFAVIPCQCRLIGELSGEPCEIASSDMGCLVTGPAAEIMANFGWAKLLTKEEALEYLKETEKAGLVHCASNSRGGEHLAFICNCCPCHCGALGPTKQFKINVVTPSNFRPQIDYDKCKICKTCVKKCPMEAITYSESTEPQINFNPDVCIGCGICAYNCPTDAIALVKISNKIPPKINKIGNKIFAQMLSELLS